MKFTARRKLSSRLINITSFIKSKNYDDDVDHHHFEMCDCHSHAHRISRLLQQYNVV